MTLQELRRQNNRTLAQVASVLKIPVSTLSNYEQGLRTIDIRLIIPLSIIYEVTAEEIISAQLTSIAVRSSD